MAGLWQAAQVTPSCREIFTIESRVAWSSAFTLLGNCELDCGAMSNRGMKIATAMMKKSFLTSEGVELIWQFSPSCFESLATLDGPRQGLFYLTDFDPGCYAFLIPCYAIKSEAS